MSSPAVLSPANARVIASLAEKSITTPQYYPMTVNAIMLAANQKSARNPFMQLSEGEVGAALNQLEQEKLCIRDTLSGRVQKWRHQFQHQLLLKPPAFAVLLSLMLRGAQTLAELRATAGVLGGPTDAEGMIGVLDSLNDRATPLLVLMPRAPGQKESRYAHTLCGAPESLPFERPVAADIPALNAGHALQSTALERRISALETRLAALERSLGISPELEG